MSFFIEVLVGGLLSGLMYSLVALGFVLIYKASSVFNFAQGAMVFFAVLSLVGFMELGLSMWMALPVTIALMVGVGVATERLVLRPLVNQAPIILFMATIGLAYFLEGLGDVMWGADIKTLDVGLPQGPALIRSEGEGILMEAAGPLMGFRDTFRFAYQTLTDDGEITARLDALTGTVGEDLAGVMIRESLAPDAAYVFVGAGADGTFRFQRRSVTAGETVWRRSVGSPLGRSWVRLLRQGDRVVALQSLDRLSWTQIGSLSMAMSRTAVLGLVVASRSADTPIQAAFGDLNVIP